MSVGDIAYYLQIHRLFKLYIIKVIKYYRQLLESGLV